MQKGKAFAVVGHKQWGKSETLKALSSGNAHARRQVIKSREFFIRHMSNDDYPRSFYALINSLDPARWPYVIAAMCPTFVDKKQRAVLIETLRSFKKRYELFFFVLRTDYHRHKRRISDDEIRNLERFGTVRVFTDANAGPEKRARALRRFIGKFI